MSIKDNAEHCVFCGKTIPEGNQVCIVCGRGKPKKQTNYDRIRNMSVEEMADYICHHYKCRKCDWENKTCSSKCIEGIKRWLESEVDAE